MPKVGDKEFPYTEAGERQANIYARQTGRQVEYDTNTYGHGSYQEGGEVAIGRQAPYKRLAEALKPKHWDAFREGIGQDYPGDNPLWAMAKEIDRDYSILKVPIDERMSIYKKKLSGLKDKFGFGTSQEDTPLGYNSDPGFFKYEKSIEEANQHDYDPGFDIQSRNEVSEMDARRPGFQQGGFVKKRGYGY